MFTSIFSHRSRSVPGIVLSSLAILIGLPTVLFLRGPLSPDAAGASALPPKKASVAPAPARQKLLFAEEKILGAYYFGDGKGVNCSLTIEQEHRFTFRWTGCLGEYDRNAGSWKLDGDVVILSPKWPNKREGFEGMNLRFIPVLWGKQCFLVDEYEMPGFCVAARSEVDLMEGVHGKDYRRREGDTWDAFSLPGKPLLPVRYRTFYEQGAVEAKVIRWEDGHRVILNKGRADRVTPDMRFSYDDFGGSELDVISCTTHESIAQPFYYWNTSEPIKVGDRFTTGNYWHRPRGTGFERFPDLPKSPSH